MPTPRDLTNRQNEIWHRMQEIVDTAEAENRDLTAEEEANWQAANADMDTVLRAIERGSRMTELDGADYDSVLEARSVDVEPETPESRSARRDAEYSRAFDLMVREGIEGLDREDRQLLAAHFVQGDPDSRESRAQATTSGSAGGYLIPPGYRAVIIERMKAFGGVMAHATILNTETGNPLQWATNDDTGNVGSILTENTQASTVAMTFGTASLGAYMYSSGIVLASLQILQDSVFPLDTWLPGHLGTRIGRAVAAHLVSGTGSGQPLGVATNATASVTGADTTTISYDNLIDLEHSLDPAYRSNCRFMMADATLAVIRKIKDSQGHPLWVPVPVPGMAPTINGQPYFIDQGMAVPGASNKSILFGDFARAYVIRHVLDMQMVRFAERYLDFLQVGFMAFTRLDATVQDANAIAAFQHHS